MNFRTLLPLFLSVACYGMTEGAVSNWTGNYAPCSQHSELLNTGPMSLRVRISSTNPILAHQFRKAMDFWREVLEFEWQEVSSGDCAIQLVDGTPALFDFCSRLSAKAHLPGRPDFEGWIAFNPVLRLPERQLFLDSVHEIGHLLGLPHNNRASSVMFYLGLRKAASLDATDLELLSLRHQLRGHSANRQLAGGVVRVAAPKQLSGYTTAAR